MNKIYIIMVLALVGCSSTGVVSTDSGQYMISKSSPQVGFGPPVKTRADVYKEANAFCAKKGQAVKTINLEITNSGFAKAGNVSLDFKCVNK